MTSTLAARNIVGAIEEPAFPINNPSPLVIKGYVGGGMSESGGGEDEKGKDKQKDFIMHSISVSVYCPHWERRVL